MGMTFNLRLEFTDEEVRDVHAAANAVWQYVGDDCIQSMAIAEGISPEKVCITKGQVMEIVMDADRVLDQLLKDKRDALANKYELLSYTQKKRLVGYAFPYKYYGL